MYSSDAIAEIVPTVQGEIKVGEPVILVRFNGCNLKCDWCDTKYTWKQNSDKLILTEEDINAVAEVHKQYPNINTLMITGGEPLLYANQSKFYELLNLEHIQVIHIETNGTLLNTPDFHIDNWVAYTVVNISPKLEQISNLDEYVKNLKQYVHEQDFQFLLSINLKFVYYKEIEYQILNFIKLVEDEFSRHNIFIMSKTPPLGQIKDMHQYASNLETFIQNDINTIKFCMKYGFTFTPRLQTYLFYGNTKEMLNK